ncbi:MAG: hypothetical protein DCC69_13960 [Hyphomicrobiales bacterium]|nr:MAG: hypothetical protein DCC69_13960 [Hyphomicrobiales bacterium]
MSVFTKLGNEIASPVDAAGNPRAVDNGDMQRWMTEAERMFVALAAEQGGSLTLPNLMIRFSNAGTGTANAIVATPTLPLPAAPGTALLTVNIVADNTGPVTLNGKPLRTNSGNEIAPGGLTAGSIHAFLDLGDHFRLLSDQASAAIVAAAEGLANAAAASALEAAGHATGAIDYVYLAGSTASLAKAVDDGTLVPAVGVVRRVSAYDAAMPVQPFNVVCTATGESAVPLPGAYQKDGTFGIGSYRFRVTQDAFQADTPLTIAPAYVEQFLTGFHARGMLADETPSIATEQAVAVTHLAGEGGVTATDATPFLPGACVTVMHDNGRYWTYFIRGRVGDALLLRPSLRWQCTAGVARLERTWFNQAHPGKFYMRQLAQRIARDPALGFALPARGRAFFTQLLESGAGAGTLAAVGAATVAYVAETTLGQGLVNMPPESTIGRAAYIACNDVYEGAETVEFTAPNGPCLARLVVMARETSPIIIRIIASVPGGASSRLAATRILSGVDLQLPRYIDIPFYAPGDAEVLRVQVLSQAATAQTIIVDQIEVFECEASAQPLIQPGSRRPRVVGFGDSWVSGDEVSTPEREAIMTQLAKELPFAEVINAGHGGDRVDALLARFDTDLAPLRPDFVVLNTATNDAYTPGSGTFDPNAIDYYCRQMQYLVSRIMEIGAKPIIIGPPALAEEDLGSSYTDWELLDRARKYSRHFYARLASTLSDQDAIIVSGPNGYARKYRGGRLECEIEALASRHTNDPIGSGGVIFTSDPVPWTFPLPFVGIPLVTASQSVSSLRTATVSSITESGCVIRVSSPVQSDVAGVISASAVGRWK